jgi:hypothetical protein
MNCKAGGHKMTNKTLGRIVVALLTIVFCLTFFSCARVPSQAVVLSRTVGERLPALQASHEAFISAYFEVSRERMEDFIDQRWIPTFLGNFVHDADLMQKLENVQPLTSGQNTQLQAKLQESGISPMDQVKVIRAVNVAFGDPDRGKLVLLFSEAALKQIETKRKSLLNPIDEQERQSLEELRKVYAQVEQAQSTVTAHLSSIHKVSEEQDQVLARLGLLKERDAIIDKALQTNQEIMGIIDAGKDAAKTVEELEAFTSKLK